MYRGSSGADPDAGRFAAHCLHGVETLTAPDTAYEEEEMDYPTIEQVQAANQEQLCWWYRFLPSPSVQLHQVEVMNLIVDRHREGGGFTPEISKRIGWGPIAGSTRER